jgi:hypothetical protein
MDDGELVAAEIFEAIRSGRDLWLYDQFVGGPDRLERARQLLINGVPPAQTLTKLLS